MLYLFFDTAVNGYYTLALLKNTFPDFLPIIPEEEKIDEDVAPFLFQIDPIMLQEFCRFNNVRLKETILLKTTASITELQNHFRQFVVQTIKGRQFYFRFWSEKVFKKYIKTCNAAQLQSFFGTVQQFVCEDEEVPIVYFYSLQSGALVVTQAAASAEIKSSNNPADSAVKVPAKYDTINSEVTIELKANRPARSFFN